MRADLVPKAMRRNVPRLPALDYRFAEAMDRGHRNSAPRAAVPSPASLALPCRGPRPMTPGPGGQTGADAILAVLDREMSRGQIIIAAQDKSLEWGRERRSPARRHRPAGETG